MLFALLPVPSEQRRRTKVITGTEVCNVTEIVPPAVRGAATVVPVPVAYG